MAAHRIENGYLTLPVGRSLLGLAVSDTSHDARIARFIGHTSRKLDRHCGRWFYPVVQTHYLSAQSGSLVTFHDVDVISLTALDTDTTGDRTYPLAWVEGTDYELLPRDAPDGSVPEPYTSIRVTPTGAKVFPLYPDAVRASGLIGYYRVLQRAQAVVGASGITDSATALEVSNVTLDPLSTGHILQIDSEQMLVTEATDAATDICTVVRAWNGTTAAAHSTAAPIDILTFPLVGAATEIEFQRLFLQHQAPFGVQGAPQFGEQTLDGALGPGALDLLEPLARRSQRTHLPVGVR